MDTLKMAQYCIIYSNPKRVSLSLNVIIILATFPDLISLNSFLKPDRFVFNPDAVSVI